LLQDECEKMSDNLTGLIQVSADWDFQNLKDTTGMEADSYHLFRIWKHAVTSELHIPSVVRFV
jgi:hypothetical protein